MSNARVTPFRWLEHTGSGITKTKLAKGVTRFKEALGLVGAMEVVEVGEVQLP